jgi:predicted metal-binding membrane protein
MQPASRVSALPRPVAAAIVSALLVCAVAAWLVTIKQAASMDMGGMAMMDAGVFLVTWVVMMIAMMFPAVAPMVLAHAAVVRSRGEGIVPTVAFVAGYLVVWSAAGLLPLAGLQILNSSFGMSISGWLPRIGGAVVVLAGIYQLTPLKNVCLKACRSPIGFIMTHDFGGGAVSAVKVGAAHGLYCLGCCWTLMAVLAVLGLMNVVWMAAFAVLFFLEKNWRSGVPLSRAVGLVCILGGLFVIAFG